MEPDADFTEVAATRWTSLVRSAVFLGVDRVEAEDVAQGVLAKIWRSWHRVSAAEDPDAYVYRMLVNHLTSLRRRQWRHEHPTDLSRHEPPTTAGPESGAVERDLVLRLLRALPLDQRRAIVLRFIADLSEAQTAAVLGVPPGTVKSRSPAASPASTRPVSWRRHD